MSLAAGTRLGPYEILAPLGAGGMGEVYRARDMRLDRTVAIKVLSTRLSADASARARFEREARAVSSLNHPHICILHDIGSQDDIDYLVLEHLEGETLAARLERGPLPLPDLLRCALEVGDALEKAHRKGLIHRDLKPGNIMLTKSGAKLLDFGVARSVAPGGAAGGATAAATMTSPLTAEGTILGTFQYMAPEVLEGGEADARSDIFGFGLILYEMAAGRRPFTGKTQASLIAAILKEDPPPLSLSQPVTPPALERLVSSCLAKDPDERRQSMHDLLLELRFLAAGGARLETVAAGAAPRRSREPYLWALVAVLAGLGAVLGLAWKRAAAVPPPREIRAYVPPPEKTVFRSTAYAAGPVAISPDGSRLVFSARREDGSEQLWLRPLDAAAATPLAGTDEGSYPFWSPDGRSIGFFASGRLKRIDPAGGPPVSLCDARDARGGTWGPDGTILFSPFSVGPLYAVPAAGGEPVAVTRLEPGSSEETHRWPQFLPGGRRFLYLVRHTYGDERNGVKVGSLDGDESRLILPGQAQAVYASGHLLFVRETTLLAQSFDLDSLTLAGEAVPIADQVQFDPSFSRGVFSASENGVLVFQTGPPPVGEQLTWFDRAGKPAGLLGDRAGYMDLSMSPDLRSVAVSLPDPRGGPPDLWIYEIARGLRTRFTFDPQPDRYPAWSPDSSRMAYSSVRKGELDLFVRPIAGASEAEPLLEAEYDQIVEDWSSDGRYLVFTTRGAPKTGMDLWILPLEGRNPTPFLQTEFTEYMARFSPDGRWIAYVSNESRVPEVYVAPFPWTGRKWQISTSGGSRPRWRGDGRELFYLAENSDIVAVQVGQEGSTFQVGPSMSLFRIRAKRVGSGFQVTPDGQRFLVNAVVDDERSDPLTLHLNWTARLGKR